MSGVDREASKPLKSGKRDSLLEVLNQLGPIDEDWPEIDDPLPEPLDDLFSWADEDWEKEQAELSASKSISAGEVEGPVVDGPGSSLRCGRDDG